MSDYTHKLPTNTPGQIQAIRTRQKLRDEAQWVYEQEHFTAQSKLSSRLAEIDEQILLGNPEDTHISEHDHHINDLEHEHE